VILTATEATLQSIPKRYHSRCQRILENGVDLQLFTSAPWPLPPSPSQPLHIVFVGRFQPFKGLPMLFEAIAQVKEKLPIKLTIVGDGPLRNCWENQAKQLQINQLITWCGQLPPAQVVTRLHAAHVLCLPSVRESGGAVLLEAMACARPVLTVKYGGPAEVIDDSVGYAIPPSGGAPAVTAALANCFYDIFEHAEAWRRRGEMGRQRAEQLYGWESKVDQMLMLYQQVIAKSRF
jgi:glycosyltransferase involved in cell wall biosynthesis